ncbi:MAG TPA: 3-hydroxylacyl-ACP dehydratase [Gammaproteobacteria bacterium]|nr:3-hydroxylacyl-ACP dehydratase [Gammaproteobacteria bacterium]
MKQGTRFPPPAELLPHAGSAVLLDGILSHTDEVIEAAANITSAHPFFVADYGVPVWVGVELMAQAIAAHAGLSGRRAGRAPRRGMLLGTRRYHAQTNWFEDGARLIVRAEREFGGEGGMAVCVCRIDCDGRTLAEARITIIEEEDK